jgi:hypothetical protein
MSRDCRPHVAPLPHAISRANQRSLRRICSAAAVQVGGDRIGGAIAGPSNRTLLVAAPSVRLAALGICADLQVEQLNRSHIWLSHQPDDDMPRYRFPECSDLVLPSANAQNSYFIPF